MQTIEFEILLDNIESDLYARGYDEFVVKAVIESLKRLGSREAVETAILRARLISK